MADSYRVRVNVAKLAANIAAAEGGSFTEDDARDYLGANDFIPVGGDIWVCEDVSLGFLDKSEILSMEAADR